MEMTEFTEFGIRRRKSSELKKILMTSILMESDWDWAQCLAKYKVMVTESFRVISKESPITELK